MVGKQFSFGLSDSPISNDEEYESSTYSVPVQVPLDSLVEFRVTSFDVNHGFSVYSSSLYPAREIYRSLPGVVRYGASPHAWGV